jgi:uncharacterized ferritin-like protein (DUF455 family)
VEQRSVAGMTATAPEMKHVLGVTLRSDPAREAWFTVVQLPRDLCEYQPGSVQWRRESLNRHFNTEVQSLEIAAQSLVDFPDAPWTVRLEHARQCWDESRHARLIERELIAQGGFAGEFPVVNYDWSVACAVNTLSGRLAVQNRTVEAGEMDVLQQLRDAWQSSNEHETAMVMDGILADEIQHVRFANSAIKSEVQRNPRAVMEVAAAITFLRTVTKAFTPAAGEQNRVGVTMAELDRAGFPVNVRDRRLAGFGDDDLAVLQSGPAS